jgi:very-short-patch-repair endonuclease
VLADTRRMLDLARSLRRDMTLPERLLWREVRGRRFGPREVHGEKLGEDGRRAAWFDAEGYRVVRFAAVEVLNNLEGVVERLLLLLDPPPAAGAATSPARGEGR